MIGPATWQAVGLVFRRADVRWRTPSGRGGRSTRAVGDDEIATIVDQLNRVASAIESWSEGAARIDPIEIRIVERPLVSLSATGPDALWAGPDDVRPEIERLARPRRPSSVFVVWPSDGSVPLCGWGCSIGPSPGALGAGFSSIVSDEWRDHARRPFPEEGFVHEWLHQVEGALRDRGIGEDRFPGLHDAEIRTSCRSSVEPPFGRTYRHWHDRNPAGHSWQEWYADWMTGRVLAPDGTCYGLTPALWREAVR
ncbi:MAG TPA: hypothetical protein VGK63_10880 [Candidatus Limnocylindrales bacterium]